VRAPPGARLAHAVVQPPTRGTTLANAADACPKNDASGIRPASVCSANFFGIMLYEGVEYVVRASLGRDEWTLLIYFPDKAPDSRPTVVKYTGSREEAGAAARRRIDNWIKRQQRGA
jgi:hypothetical protein